jgi:hypothetical protein
MNAQSEKLSDLQFSFLEDLLKYSLFHHELESEDDRKIFSVIRKFELIKKIGESEIPEELFEDLKTSLNILNDLIKNDISFSIKYNSSQTQARLNTLLSDLKNESLTTVEKEKILDDLSIYMYKLKFYNQ